MSLGHRDRRAGEGSIGRRLVAGLPREDVVRMVALAVRTFGLAGEVFAQHGRIRFERGEGVDHDGQFVVLDDHRLDAVGRGIAVLGDDDRDFLHLEAHLLVGQDRLHVAGQCRHPVQLERLEIVGGEHRDDAGHLQRLASCRSS